MARVETPSRMISLLPVYLVSIARTTASGLVNSAILYFMTYETSFDTYIVGIVGSVFNLGFITFVLTFGRFIDKFNRASILKIVSLILFVCSFMYLIPIGSIHVVVLFCCFRFLDGGVTGLFWTTVQSYAKYAAEIGNKCRNEYTSRYNFSWNFGIILGMTIGWLAALASNTNVYGLYINIIVVIIQLCSIVFLKKIPARIKKTTTSDGTGDGEKQEGSSNLNGLNQSEKKTISALPAIVVFLALLTHSFSQGAMSIFLPSKLIVISSVIFIPYMVSFINSVTQTFFITRGSHNEEKTIVPAILILPLLIGAGWLIIGTSTSVFVICLGVFILGMVQGTLYASGMRFLTNVAQQSGNSRIFAHYQFTMGFGRMIGPLLLGFLLEISLNAGFASLILFDLVVFSILVASFLLRKKARDK
ncbi:MAG: MFS transporter [Promethearchaeota archaeon]